MTHLLKRFLQISLLLICIIFLGMLSIVYFVNPNQFKSTIEAKVLAQTGQVLQIKGPMNWKLSPTLMLELEDVRLSNLKPFSDALFSAKKIHVDLSLASLFSRKVMFNLKLKAAHIYLQRNSDGQTNWQTLLNPKKQPELLEDHSVAVSNVNSKSFTILLNSLEVEDSELTFQDKVKNSHYQIKKLAVSMNSVMKAALGIHNPIKLSFEALDLNKNASGKVVLKANWNFNVLQDELNICDLACHLEFGNLKASSINGNIQAKGLISKDPLIHADFKGNDWKYNKVLLDSIQGKITAKSGIINIAPLVINIAQSRQEANIQIDLRDNLPKYIINSQSHNFEIMSLLALFDIENKLQGKTSYKVSFTATGNTAEQIKKSLSGNSEIEIKDGKFSGADLITLLKSLNSNVYNVTRSMAKKPSLHLAGSAQSLQDLWKQKQMAVHPNASTPFNSLKASININNGIAHNPDLQITHPEYTVTGKGNIHLIHQSIEYHTAARLNHNPHPEKDDLANYLYSSSLPIHLSGPFGNLSILPDVKTYANNAFVFAQKNFLEKSIKQETSKVVNHLIGKHLDKGMDQNAGQSGEKPADNVKVNKAIESTLNSLFE